MSKRKNKYIVDSRGKAVSVVMDINEYRALLSEMEELESIKAYDKAKSIKSEIISFEQAVREIEENRK